MLGMQNLTGKNVSSWKSKGLLGCRKANFYEEIIFLNDSIGSILKEKTLRGKVKAVACVKDKNIM
jgi:hypothetical protein